MAPADGATMCLQASKVPTAVLSTTARAKKKKQQKDKDKDKEAPAQTLEEEQPGDGLFCNP